MVWVGITLTHAIVLNLSCAPGGLCIVCLYLDELHTLTLVGEVPPT